MQIVKNANTKTEANSINFALFDVNIYIILTQY